MLLTSIATNGDRRIRQETILMTRFVPAPLPAPMVTMNPAIDGASNNTLTAIQS
jgi:hypothetical protein